MKTVFFDLDGTLSDPKIGITKSIQYALERLDVPVPATDDLLWCIGPPLRASFVELVDEARADQGVALYRERFGDVGLYENDLYDGIPDTLQAFSDAGTRLFVATSKPHVYARRIVEHFGIAGHFERVFGSELDGTRADKSELLEYALQETGLQAEACAMIGDREHDMIGAVNNGLFGIGALYGYGTQEELEAAGARRLADAPSSIAAKLKG
ncbi:MAG: HAD hydrolase-like protein [Rhodospirillaceae bacterium]|nr:HAD hydrolase-like protein [Rhodospirillaceae bacterium]MDD9916730.1 HAD hydrolase-like protein [Rhodospirillaceae bacterium]MDD9924621.1 HAD hydrolase-like protein [Rhodospirillaceae bacterium]